MTSLSKAEYLKKYLSGPSTAQGDYEDEAHRKKKHKKHKKDKSKRPEGIRIIDHDVDLSSVRAPARDVYSESEDEAPQVDGSGGVSALP
eukprot:1664505-Prymnesium_polylepis.2